MAKEKIITAIDIGSTKISTTIASVNENKISVIGVSGNVPSKGIKKGNVIDIDAAVEAISTSIERAERMAGVSVTSAFISINGSHIETLNSHGVVAVSPSQSAEISNDDVSRVIEAAQAVSLPSSREIIHVLPRDFIVDSQDGIKDPVGMSGVRLEVETNIIHGASGAMKNLTRCITQVGAEVEELVYAGLGASEAVLTDTEKELGTLLVDIGGGTTSMIAFNDGSPLHSAVLPIGGKLITSDLAIGLRTRLEEAEKIKLKLSNEISIPKAATFEFSSAAGKRNDDFDVSEFGLDVPAISKSLLYKIIDSRLEEIFRLVALELAKSNLNGKLPAGVVLCGGGALTAGAERIAKMTLKMPTRLGVPRGVTGLIDEIQGPASAVNVGTIIYGANMTKSGKLLSFENNRGNMKKSFSKFFEKFKSFLP